MNRRERLRQALEDRYGPRAVAMGCWLIICVILVVIFIAYKLLMSGSKAQP